MPSYCDPTGAGNTIINQTLPQGERPCPTASYRPYSTTTLTDGEVEQIDNQKIHSSRVRLRDILIGLGSATGTGIAGRLFYKRTKRYHRNHGFNG